MITHHADELTPRTLAIARSLIQPVLRTYNPLESVDTILETIVHSSLEATPADYLQALDEALASKVPLAQLLPEYHPEVIVRRFLAEVRRRLVTPAN